MELLDLSWNRLEGEIPQSLTKLTFLAFLNLSQNHLVGRIPEGAQFSTFSEDAYYGNPELCGWPLPRRIHCRQLSSPQVETKGGVWIYIEPVMLGLGCGTLLGLV
ncbi:putative transferase [Helianthus anomalus]